MNRGKQSVKKIRLILETYRQNVVPSILVLVIMTISLLVMTVSLGQYRLSTYTLDLLAHAGLENADYFRCENISIGYTFPRSVLKFADLRLTLSCQNLFTITSYKGMDPAGASFSDKNVDNNNGIDMGVYPNPRTFTFGVRMNF